MDEQGNLPTGSDRATKDRWPENWPLSREPYTLETSVSGSFAVGDVRQGSPSCSSRRTSYRSL
jgi:thioredoxin reductase (NADPH)